MPSVIPGVIIWVNSGISENVQEMLVRQLFLDQVIDGSEFSLRVDGYVSGITISEDYNSYVKRNSQRILVINDITDLTNRGLVDVACQLKHGLISILTNKYGPYGQTFPVTNLTWSKLGIHLENRRL
jgi:hypothetical protein